MRKKGSKRGIWTDIKKFTGQCPDIKEPEKFETFGWFARDNLPVPLFKPLEYAVQSFLTQNSYWDSRK